jgi:hypothetical protein
MGHIIGIGTQWRYKLLVSSRLGPGAGIQSAVVGCSYYGANANREWKALTGCDTVPIDQKHCDHFQEECLKTELMTGKIGNETKTPASTVTLGALEVGWYIGSLTKTFNCPYYPLIHALSLSRGNLTLRTSYHTQKHVSATLGSWIQSGLFQSRAVQCIQY